MVINMLDKYLRYGDGGGLGGASSERPMGLSERVRRNIERDSERGGPDPKLDKFRADLERRKRDLMTAILSQEEEGLAADVGSLLPAASGGIMGLRSGGLVGFRHGGMPASPPQGGLPANYGAPPGYAGYGTPSGFSQRQEYLSPEIAQQYADLTKGITKAGTRGYEDVRYRGPQLAGFTGMEAAAQAGAGAYGRGAGPRGTIQAASTLDQAARGIGSIIPEQEALARQYGTMATGAKKLGTDAETAFKEVGTGIRSLADTSAIAERGYGTRADTLGRATEAAQRGYGTTAGELGTTAAAAQRGYGTAAGTAATTSVADQREKAAKDYATQSAKSQRELGTKLGAPQLQKSADMSEYMSQYTKGVTDPQLQQLMEFQRMQGQELGSQAAQSGAFGGSRADVEQRKLREQTGQQAADIIGKSQQEAFQSAQAAFQGDRSAQQQAQTAQLAAERGALAAETGQQATQLSAEQQALSQEMDAQRFGAGQEQAATQTAMDAQRFGAGQEQAAHQARMDAERFGLGVEQGAHQTAVGGRQADLAAQQAAFGAAQQGYGTAADMMGGQGRAMAAGTAAYGQLAGIGRDQMALGRDQQGQQMERFDMMNRYGGQQRKLQQASLDIKKAEHEKAMQYPERQLAWMNQQYGALPYQNLVSQSSYAPQSGPVSTALGAVTGGFGAAADWRAGLPGSTPPGQAGGLPTPFTPTAPAMSGVPLPTSWGTQFAPTPTNPSGVPNASSWNASAPTLGADPWGVANVGAPGNIGAVDIGPAPTKPAWMGAAGGMIGSYNTGGYLPYAGGGYLSHPPGIIGVGRGMGR